MKNKKALNFRLDKTSHKKQYLKEIYETYYETLKVVFNTDQDSDEPL